MWKIDRRWIMAVLLPMLFVTVSCERNVEIHGQRLMPKAKTAPVEKEEALESGTLEIEEESEENNTLFDLVYEIKEESTIDLADIKERGEIIALTGYSHTGYFLYKGTPMGYEYDLLKNLADHLGVKLNIKVVDSKDKMFEMLRKGEGDIIASNLLVTKNKRPYIEFTHHHNTSRQVLVQKKPKNWRQMTASEVNKVLIKDLLDLGNKDVHVIKSSPYVMRLRNLSNEIGSNINIIEEDTNTGVEDLIQAVAEGEIEYTIADENIAMLNQSYYADLDISTPISFSQKQAWAVRKNSPELLEAVNDWVLRMKNKPFYYVIYNKYFKLKKGLDQQIKCSREMTCGKNLSPYDTIIQKHATEIGWDWRLLASLIYQESRFDPKARSWAGASGLMQLMPATAKEFGAHDPFDPEQAIAAGAKYLKWLDNYWSNKVEDPDERLKFILASYNVGQAHVADAVRLAKKYKKQPDVWDDNVAYFVLNKSKPKYSNDPVVKYGYCRGSEPFNYVKSILNRYNHYQNLLQEEVALPNS
ncbi:transporter substrate-binding domain-containing protein [Cytophagaceae bacterium ABcell3]|nr:transporter substrate-binding domain-containing protein [Cytophagaceae bacterium ABcell3]